MTAARHQTAVLKKCSITGFSEKYLKIMFLWHTSWGKVLILLSLHEIYQYSENISPMTLWQVPFCSTTKVIIIWNTKQIKNLPNQSFEVVLYIVLYISCTFLQKKSWTIHCVKSVRIQSYSCPHFFTLNLSVFSLNARKCKKNADQNNSKCGRFLSSDS